MCSVTVQPDQPPSMTCAVPVVNADSSLARYTASAATSSARPMRPMGWRAIKAACTVASAWPLTRACSAMRWRSEGESTVPGQIALQRMPWPTKSAATDLVRPMTAALLVPYTKRLETPFMLDATEAMLMMEPCRRSIMPGRNTRISRYMARTFSSKEKSQAASSHSRIVPACTKPAPLNSTSTGPASAAPRAAAAGSVASSLMAVQPGTAPTASGSRSAASTCAPSRAYASAVARPMPCPAAVTNAVFPCNLPDMPGSPVVAARGRPVLPDSAPAKQFRQPHTDAGHIGNDDKRHEQRHQPGQDGHGRALNRQLGHPRQYEQHHAQRRVQQPYHQIQRHHQSEVNGVDAQLQHQRQQDGHQDGDGRNGVDEAAHDQDQHVGQQQKHPLVV